MKTLGALLIRSRRNAALLAFILVFIPILHWFSVIIMALITLRRGAKEGTLILVSMLAAIALSTLISGTLISGTLISGNSVIIYNTVLAVMLVWLLGIILHHTHSWSLVLLVAASLAIFAITAIHWYIPDVDQWWQHSMLNYLQQLGADMSINLLQQKQTVIYLSRIATGIQTDILLLFNLTFLLLARYWQGTLYNPGALQAELHAIRMPRWVSLCLLILLLATLLFRIPLLIDLLPVLFLPFICAGLSLVHFAMLARKINWLWLLFFYILLIFALPYVCMMLVILALIDSLIDLRQRFKHRRDDEIREV